MSVLDYHQIRVPDNAMLTFRRNHCYSWWPTCSEWHLMKKIKSPWYAMVWIAIWTIALVWFLVSGHFNERESTGLVLAWMVLVGSTVYMLIRHGRQSLRQQALRAPQAAAHPSLNGPCPCGSGRKYKRCCGV